MWTKTSILGLLNHEDLNIQATMVKRSLLKLYSMQTADEQAIGATTEHNGFGFNGVDAEFMSSVARQLNEKGFITPKQGDWVHKKILKYAGQLADLANLDLNEEVA